MRIYVLYCYNLHVESSLLTEATLRKFLLCELQQVKGYESKEERILDQKQIKQKDDKEEHTKQETEQKKRETKKNVISIHK